ncbi:MAG: type IV pilus biogenesis/stability protein PilW [Pseudomonadota bacterium]
MKRLGLAAWFGFLVFLSGCQRNPVKPAETPADNRTETSGPADIYVQLGAAYLSKGNLPVALQNLQKALALDAKNSQAHNFMGMLQEHLGNSPQAEEHFRQAAALSPGDSDIHNAYGNFLCNQQRFEEADREFRQALDNPLFSNPWMPLTNAGQCARRSGDPVRAEGYLRRALSLNPSYSRAVAGMANAQFDQGHYPAARGYIQRYLGAYPATPDMLWLAIRTERKLGDLKSAAQYQQTLLTRFPDAPEVQSLNEPSHP